MSVPVKEVICSWLPPPQVTEHVVQSLTSPATHSDAAVATSEHSTTARSITLPFDRELSNWLVPLPELEQTSGVVVEIV